MRIHLLVGLGLVASVAQAEHLCLHSARGEGYDDQSSTDLTLRGFSNDGVECDTGGRGPQMFVLSRSDVDISQTSGRLTEPVLYLWAVAGTGYGFHNGFTHYEGDLRITRVEGIGGARITHTEDPPRILYVATRPADFDLEAPVARIHVELPVSVTSGSWGRIKSLYEAQVEEAGQP